MIFNVRELLDQNEEANGGESSIEHSFPLSKWEVMRTWIKTAAGRIGEKIDSRDRQRKSIVFGE